MPQGMKIAPPPPQNRRKRGGRVQFVNSEHNYREEPRSPPTIEDNPSLGKLNLINSEFITSAPDDAPAATPPSELTTPSPPIPQLTDAEALEKVTEPPPNLTINSEQVYCPECYLPLHPDPKPEKLYIFLHALKYTTSLGAFETSMPEWAAEDFVWDQS